VLEPAARAELESRGVGVSETGIYDCSQQLAEQARFSFEVFWAQSGLPLGNALAEWRRQWLGANDQSMFAIRHGISLRSVLLLEKHNRIPRDAYTRRELERAYMLPQGFLRAVLEERKSAR